MAKTIKKIANFAIIVDRLEKKVYPDGWVVNPPIRYAVLAYVSLSMISSASPTRKSTIAVIMMV